MKVSKDKRILNITVSVMMYDTLKRLKEKTGHSITTLVRLALIDYIRKISR